MTNKKLYTLDEIDAIILAYKTHPTKELYTTIVNAFEGFIIKYASFLKFGSCIDDSEISLLRKLISDFIDNKYMKNIKLNMLSCDPMTRIYRILNGWEIDDIKCELRIIFFNCIKRFKKIPGPSFAGYIKKYFKYAILLWIKKLMTDALNTSDIVTINEEIEIRNETVDSPVIKTDNENICLSSTLPLNLEEKYILYLTCGKNMSYNEVSKCVGISRQQVFFIIKKAREKLKNSGITLDNI